MLCGGESPSKGRLLRWVWLLPVLCGGCVSICSCSGRFQLRILAYRNIRGELGDGSCCSSRESQQSTMHLSQQQQGNRVNSSRTVDTVCWGLWNVYFKVCLREHVTRVVPDGMCTFGNMTNEARLGAVMEFAEDDDNYWFVLPFDFAWTVSRSSISVRSLSLPSVRRCVYVCLCLFLSVRCRLPTSLFVVAQ